MPRVYVHDPISLPARKRLVTHISGYALYVERALILARPEDVVCTFGAVDSDYLAYLRELGLGPDPSHVVWPKGPASTCVPVASRICRSPADIERLVGCLGSARRCMVSPFFLGPDEVRLAAMLQDAAGVDVLLAGGSPSLSARLALKSVVREQAERRGVPLPRSRTVRVARNEGGTLTDPADIVTAVRCAVDAAGGAVVHGNDGVAGSANYMFRRENADPAAICRALGRDGNTTFLVDDLMPADVSPNVLVNVPLDSEPPVLVGTSDQILNDALEHQGNIAPSRAARLDDMVRDALQLAGWLQQEGYTGPAGFDFIEWGPPSAPQYALCELNPRINGASYPLGLLDRLRGPGCGACLSVNLKTNAASFAQLREQLAGFLLQPGKSSGLLPYNTGCLRFGKFTGAFLAASPEDAEHAVAEVRRLPTIE
jgi:hypothetical protein